MIPHLAKGQPFPSKLDCSISSIGCQHNYNSEKKVTPRTKRKARSSLHSSGNGKVPLFPVPPIAPHIFDPTHLNRAPPPSAHAESTGGFLCRRRPMAGEDRETFFPLSPCSRKGGGERAREVTEGKRGKGARPGLRPLPGEERQREGGAAFFRFRRRRRRKRQANGRRRCKGDFLEKILWLCVALVLGGLGRRSWIACLDSNPQKLQMWQTNFNVALR